MCLILHAECAQHEANREIKIKIDKNDTDHRCAQPRHHTKFVVGKVR
jgi:hypothetical protein